MSLFQGVLDALQKFEELSGPDAANYIKQMKELKENIDNRIDAAREQLPKFLPDDVRTKLQEILVEDGLESFDRSSNRDMLRGGAEIPGVDSMCDEELVTCYEEYTDQDDEFLLELKGYKAEFEMLSRPNGEQLHICI